MITEDKDKGITPVTPLNIEDNFSAYLFLLNLETKMNSF